MVRSLYSPLQLFFVLIKIPILLVNPPWRLVRLPENYTLWVHKKGFETDPANPRIDAYLYGAPHLSPRTSRGSRFRSPTEFVPHAIWLMKGSTGQCDCKYCLPGQHQKDINCRLNHGVDDPDDESIQDDDDDDDDGGGSGSGSGVTPTTATTNRSSSASRRRGASAGARRARRARRDRSPPVMIKAKDYRVGMNGDRGPGPGGPSSAT